METKQTVNGVDLEALNQTIDAVRGDRTLGKVSFAVNGEWQGGFRVNSQTGGLTQAGQVDNSRRGKFTMSSDEPASLLGTDTAISPAEYMLQALAGCYTVTLAANAAARGIELESATRSSWRPISTWPRSSALHRKKLPAPGGSALGSISLRRPPVGKNCRTSWTPCRNAPPSGTRWSGPST